MKTKQWMAIFIVLLMASSTFGFIYGFSSQAVQNNINYKGQEFLPSGDGRWFTEINNVQFVFDYSPDSLNEIEIPEFNFGNKVYILFDPAEDNEYVNYNMQKLIYTLQATNRIAVSACGREEECPMDVPIKSCSDDAVYIKNATESKIYKEENCIVVEGNRESISKAVDRLNLELVGLS